MELVVENLQTHFRLPGSRLARAVDGISFTVKAGQTVALVGESGSGKSQTAYSIMRLMPENAVHGPQSRILLDGRNLLVNSATEMRQIRGNTIAMIFQEPMTSLNPLYRIGNQLGEPLQLHQGMDGEQARARGIELLDEVGLPDPETRIDAFPHEL
ncbi:MAG TPA: ABC transporter ATP-binding protein, partial [Lentisphaeria bacterium]|nr:ABC transporter ATP-binding protein [Lentisphaeria bacterium]